VFSFGASDLTLGQSLEQLFNPGIAQENRLAIQEIGGNRHDSFWGNGTLCIKVK